MDKFKELADFSMFEGSIPCVICKGESAKTLLGDHWKCSKCDHIFNEDGSDIQVDCYCEPCVAKMKEKASEDQAEQVQQLEDLIKKVREAREAEKKKPE